MRHKRWRGLYITATRHYEVYVEYEITRLEQDGDAVIRGTVKYDGCTDWTFPEGAIWHTCTRKELQKYSDMLMMCFDWTKEILGKHWDGDETNWG